MSPKMSSVKKKPWKTISYEYVFENPFVKVRKDKLELQDGSHHDYFVIEKRDFCTALCLTPNNKVVLLKHFRQAVNDFVYELPAGLLEDGENPRVAMERELLEETGFKAELELVGMVLRDPASDASKGFIFLGKNAVFKQKPVLEKLEDITVELHPWQEALRLATENDFKHPLFIATVYWCLDKAGLLKER